MQLINEEDLLITIRNAPIGICILNATTLIAEMLNDKFLEVAGKPSDAIIGKFYWDAFAEAKERYEPVLNKVVQSGEPFRADDAQLTLVRHGRQETVFVTFVYSPVKNKQGTVTKVVVWVLENTSQVVARQKIEAANAELAESESRFKTMAEGSGILIAVGDETSNATYFSKAWVELTGRSMNDLLAFGWADLIHAEDRQPYVNIYLKAFKKQLPFTGEFRVLNNMGEYRWLLANGQPRFRIDGTFAGYISSCVDITERKQWENSLNESSAELQAMNEEMASANEELTTINEELSESREDMQKLLTELAASEFQTRSIIEAAPFPIGIYVGKEMRIMFANKSIINVFGKGDDVIGKLYTEILPELDNQAVFKQLDEVFTTGIPFEARNQRIDIDVDGEIRTYYFNYNFTPLYNEAGQVYAVMNTAADVTDVVVSKQQLEETSNALFNLNEELAAINEELTVSNEEQAEVNLQLNIMNDKFRSAQDELQLAIQAAALGTFDLDPATGRFVGNDQLKAWFGLAPEDEIELYKATNVIAEADRDRVMAAIQKVLTYGGGNYDINYTIINPLNPVPRIVRAQGKALFNEQQQPIRLSGVVQDITEQKRDEQRKNDFIGMVSHELKTPLTSLNAIVQVANAKLKNSPDEFLAGAMDKANAQVKKMTTMINGFLNISRLESGKIQLDKSKFDLKQLIENTISETKLISTGYEINLSLCDISPVYADQDKIGSVISNLLSNAIKYSPRGTEIEVSCKTTGNEVKVSIRDEGIGVKPEDIKHLFDRYYRVNNPNYSHISGFGIGLYLSSEIVRQHNGTIGVDSELGKGSTFWFTLPV